MPPCCSIPLSTTELTTHILPLPTLYLLLLCAHLYAHCVSRQMNAWPSYPTQLALFFALAACLPGGPLVLDCPALVCAPNFATRHCVLHMSHLPNSRLLFKPKLSMGRGPTHFHRATAPPSDPLPVAGTSLHAQLASASTSQLHCSVPTCGMLHHTQKQRAVHMCTCKLPHAAVRIARERTHVLWAHQPPCQPPPPPPMLGAWFCQAPPPPPP